MANGPAHEGLCAVGLRRVDKVDAQVERLAYDAHRFGLAVARFLAQPARPARAQADDAGAEVGAAQLNVVHEKSSVDDDDYVDYNVDRNTQYFLYKQR